MGGSSSSDIEVSVVIPTRDEEKTIATCIRKVQETFIKNNIKGEIIVSDSSSDRTGEIATRMGARVVHPAHAGYGAAYLDAFPLAQGKKVVMGDGDDTYDFSELPLLLGPLDNGADMVIGSRFMGTITRGSMKSLHRYIGNPLLTRMINFVYGVSLSDAHSGFRAIRRDKLEKLELHTPGMEFASEMLIEASKKNLAIEEVPVNYYPRKSSSKLHSFADGWRHVRLVLLHRPFPFIALPGLVFAFAGLMLIGIFSLQGNIESQHLHSFILGALMLIGGFQVIFFSVLIRIYSVIQGFEERKGFIDKIMNYHNLEKMLAVGGVLFIIGLYIGIELILTWSGKNFGYLFEIIPAISAFTLTIIGLEIITASIFISMMLLTDQASTY
jgi:glycosyltransferase involved in cell wall biosynthesis